MIASTSGYLHAPLAAATEDPGASPIFGKHLWRGGSSMSADTAKSLEGGRRCTERAIVEIAAARKAWAIFEALNGREDADRVTLRDSVKKLGLSTSANAIAKALVRDTLLTLFRITDAPGTDKLTLCRISACLQDANVVSSLVADARKWSAGLPHSQTMNDTDEATCRAHITFIKDLARLSPSARSGWRDLL